jgi:ABC-type sugar transport system ATPase subunit
LIVMDEPTAVLGDDDTTRLFRTMRRLTERGVTLLFISHFLEQTLEICSTVSVLRNGKVVLSEMASGLTVQQILASMLGRTTADTYPSLPTVRADAPIRLAVRETDDAQGGTSREVTVCAGEIVGIFGLVGSGRSSFAHGIFGAHRYRGVEFRLNHERYIPSNPRRAMALGIGLLPESRKSQGLFLRRSEVDNAILHVLRECVRWRWLVRRGEERRRALTGLEACGVNPLNAQLEVGFLSGGNQQKVLFAKTLASNPLVLILDEPTRGVDINARSGIYRILIDQLTSGAAILLISSDLDEVWEMSHRIVVMRAGRVAREYRQDSTTKAQVLAAALGAEGPHGG